MGRLRYNTCGSYFTAPLPATVLSDGEANQKYAYSAQSIMGISKFGMDSAYLSLPPVFSINLVFLKCALPGVKLICDSHFKFQASFHQKPTS
ncbi:MAG: transposase [Osedax symbiont Rs1]|nr:MAG: transposase [Osedax symbiont Rs1]